MEHPAKRQRIEQEGGGPYYIAPVVGPDGQPQHQHQHQYQQQYMQQYVPQYMPQCMPQYIPPSMATAPSAEASLREQIDSLPTSTVKDLLLQAAMRDHAVATRVSATSRVARIEEIVKTTSAHMMEMWTAENKRLEALAAESKRVIDFDSYSKSAWHELNTKYACASGSREYEYALFFFFFLISRRGIFGRI